MESSSQHPRNPIKDPRTIARKYQLDLCKRAVDENIIVYLGTGCGKTHIAVLLMYELGHLIRKPSSSVCVFLAPTVPLVRQQAMVIENCTDFKVQSYFGNGKHLKDHHEWNKEIEQIEVLVMTPQILLHNLRHCFIRMELIALLIFDECHHAQAQKRHPYAQIMKEFYKMDALRSPRIFGMTASPIIGKGGSTQTNYTKCINSLENLLDAKMCSIDDNLELESFVASPEIKVYFYDPVEHNESSLIMVYQRELDQIRNKCTCMLRENISDLKDRQKLMKSVLKIHEKVVFCLENLGLYAAIQAVQILLTSDGLDIPDTKQNDDDSNTYLVNQYLNNARSVLCCKILDDNMGSDSFVPETLEEPFFLKKLSALIGILSSSRLKENMKCIIFVKRIIVARTLAHILGSLKVLDYWKCEFLVGFHSGLRNMSRSKVNTIVEKFRSGEVNLLVATNVAEEGLDIQTCCLVVRFDLPETVASFIQSRGRARMQKSEFVFLVERGNLRDEQLLHDFMSGENFMNKEVIARTSGETFNNLEETIYKVDSTGASISTGCSISLLYRYCDKLPRDIYFDPLPKFFFIDDIHGTICRVILPSNAPVRQVDSLPCSSKDEAKRAACLKACIELHKKGALTNYLLPGLDDGKRKILATNCSESQNSDDECLREELHEMLVPAVLRMPWSTTDDVDFYFYYIKCVPIPDDRNYRKFGLFVKVPIPDEAETMEVDLHLAHGRIVKTGFVSMGKITLDREEVLLAESFQEMFLKVILDRSDFYHDFVSLGENAAISPPSSTFYLLLPVKKKKCEENMVVDWETVKRCLSSPVFSHSTVSHARDLCDVSNSLKLYNGTFAENDVFDSVVFTQHNKLFYFIYGILHEKNALSKHRNSTSYAEHYMDKFGIQLSYPEQPLLKAKQVFSLHNLLHNRVQEGTDTRELLEHFVELPPEMCLLKIFGFSKDIGSTLSLLPSLLHRLENLLVAIELKELLSASFPDATKVRAECILEALTAEKCMERISLERFEVLGDSFLKYIVGRHSFLSYQGLDEGQLTKKRSSMVNNSHLYELAIQKNLQVYIRDELFLPSNFFALGRPCKVVCDVDIQSSIHHQQGNGSTVNAKEASNVKCTRSHRWIHRKTIADVVEALVGVFLVESGFRAAIAFLQWIGMQVDFEVCDFYRVLQESRSNLELSKSIDVDALEKLLGYRFKHRGLLLQAFVHPSYNKHSGGCYQKLEFLGDAVLDYMITSYIYSVYPDLKPGQITDLRSITVNNNSLAHIAVWKFFHEYLIKESDSLSRAIKKFKDFIQTSDAERELTEEPACPKVLGDVVESSIGAVLLDAGFDLNLVWNIMLNLLEPILRFSSLQINPVRELRELCQSYSFELGLPDPVKQKEGYSVWVEIDVKGKHLTYSAVNNNSKAARRTAAQEALCKLKVHICCICIRGRKTCCVVQSTKPSKTELIAFK
ncbi:endoribonuclease Dicer homolog 4-like isoform X2 [Asparagus officinalis]|uniref:endoribonuclease Dicer homolog 4-like isoform X2 n=1 Tax=Asparagus officinalis TaxID=4686 RepID=UPI00098DFFFA|nr:endoribonuclease Dicer homolog 4-like isoform X2 [Asparagus officinalis]